MVWLRCQLPLRVDWKLRHQRQDRTGRYDWRKFLKSPPSANRILTSEGLFRKQLQNRSGLRNELQGGTFPEGCEPYAWHSTEAVACHPRVLSADMYQVSLELVSLGRKIAIAERCWANFKVCGFSTTDGHASLPMSLLRTRIRRT